MAHTAEFNLHDNKLKLYLDQNNRIPRDEFDTIRKTGLAWWRASKCFAGTWSPEREDLVLRYVDEIETIIDDDTGLEYRLSRYSKYSGNASAHADQYQKRMDDLTEHIPPGQPILVGHHSERQARKHQKELDSLMRKSVYEQEKADYWVYRTERAEKHAAFKERPDVIRRRVEGYEADLRLWQRRLDGTDQDAWARADQTPEQKAASDQRCLRWIEHLEMVLEYQRELYERSGKVALDRGEVTLEVGGAVRTRHGLMPIISVNQKTVTVPDTWHWPLDGISFAHVFTRKVYKANLGGKSAVSKAEYEASPDYAMGQAMLAVLEGRHKAKFEIEKGGAIKYRYGHWSPGNDSGWLEVVRVNKNTVTVKKFDSFGNRCYEAKVENTTICASMSKADWQKEKAI